jgi:hypothetical protein
MDRPRAIEKIERLREADESIGALIEVLTAVLSPRMEGRSSQRFEPGWSAGLINAVAARVLDQISGASLAAMRKRVNPSAPAAAPHIVWQGR